MARLTRSLVEAAPITDVEMALGTTRFLPPPAAIPEAFWQGNLYTRLAEALFYGTELPALVIRLRAGWDTEQLRRIVRSHLAASEPAPAHKLAGVGFLIAQIAVLSAASAHAEPVPVPAPEAAAP